MKKARVPILLVVLAALLWFVFAPERGEQPQGTAGSTGESAESPAVPEQDFATPRPIETVSAKPEEDVRFPAGVPTDLSHIGYVSSGINSWTTNDYVQSFTVVNFTEVKAADFVFDYNLDDWGDPVQYSGTSSFTITAAGSNGPDFFYFGGVAVNNDAVLEEWKLKPKIGMPGAPPRKIFKKMEIYRKRKTEIDAAHPKANVKDFVDHIDHAVKLIGLDHVAISSDFDGGGGVEGWNNAAETFNVTLEMVRRGYTEEQIAQIWSGNTLRLWRYVEKVAARLQSGK